MPNSNFMKKISKTEKIVSKSILKYNSDVSLTSSTEMNFTELITVPCKEYKTEKDVITSKNYKFLKQIGRGAYGEVYKTEHESSNAVLACKVIDLNSRNYERMMRHLKTEIYVLMKCKHINIIEVVDHFVINQKAFIFMEFANAGSLSQFTSKPFEEEKSRKFFVQMLNGLIHLHQNGIAHRDLKLDNVLLLIDSSNNKIIKITDFGLSVAAYKQNKGYIEPGTFAGTRVYMSPEIIRIRVYREFRQDVCFDFDPFKADIWALGVCLFELITSRMPFESNFDEELLRQQENEYYKTNVYFNMSKPCQDIIAKMLTTNPDNRIDPFGLLTHQWLQSI